jgi:2-polyprenyl-3-methyl-5-hydroxy-6-metoxy-1,4-benzoquinol methylase
MAIKKKLILYIEQMKKIIRGVPILGFLTWWAYMIIRAPSKINQLFQMVNALRRNDEIYELKASQLSSGVNSMRKDAKKVFVNWTEFYSEEITNKQMIENIEHHRYFIDLICKWANIISEGRVAKLIEIGVGTGTMSIYLSKKYFDVVGLDAEPLLIAKAIETNRRLSGSAKFIVMDVLELPRLFKENTFDIAFSQGTIEHFDNDDLEKLIKAQLTVARHVIFSVPSVNWPHKEFGNERKMTLEEWERLLREFGVKIEHISYYQKGDLHIAAVISSDSRY